MSWKSVKFRIFQKMVKDMFVLTLPMTTKFYELIWVFILWEILTVPCLYFEELYYSFYFVAYFFTFFWHSESEGDEPESAGSEDEPGLRSTDSQHSEV